MAIDALHESKRCSKCRQPKPRSEFRDRPGSRLGLQSQCKPCQTETRRKASKKWHATNKDYIISAKRQRLMLRYGMTLEDYENRLAEQGGGCAICGGVNYSGRNLAVDHCHATGDVRALLCDRCNRGIGYFGECAELMRKTIDYLNEHHQRRQKVRA